MPYGLTRKDQNGRTRMGITAYAIMFVVLFGVTFFILQRRGAQETPKQQRSAPGVAQTQRSSQGLASWQDVELPSGMQERLDDEGPKQRTTPKPQQGILEMESLRITDLSQDMSEYQPVIQENANSFETLLNRGGTGLGKGIRLEVADDGNEYLRAGSGIYTAFAQPGTRLKGPDNQNYIIGDDGMLYVLENNGERTLVRKYIDGRFRDLAFRFYSIDRDSSQLLLRTPGGPGLFRAPDGQRYSVKDNGDLAALDAEGKERIVETITGEGEFQGTDGQIYLLSNGVLFAPASQDVSFAASNITGEGMFRGPNGKVYFKGDDGLLYTYDENNDLVLSNLTGSGQFRGPDGSLYRADNGNAVKVQPTEPPLPPSGDPAPAQTEGTARGLGGTAQTDNNLLNFNTSEGFTPETAAGNMNSGSVYTLSKEDREKLDSEGQEPEPVPPTKFLPLGQKIPFYLLSTVTTQFTNPGVVEAVVAENVYFHDNMIPAGTRIYGRYSQEADKGDRLAIEFRTMVNTQGQSLNFSGHVYDTSMTFGLEAYYKPTPLWVYGLRYANVALVYELQKRQPVDEDGRPIGDLSNVFEMLDDTVADITNKNLGYYIIPDGTAGIIMLNADLDLKWSRGGANQGTSAIAANLMSEVERQQQMATAFMPGNTPGAGGRQVAAPMNPETVNGILENSRAAVQNIPGGAEAYSQFGGSQNAQTMEELSNLFQN